MGIDDNKSGPPPLDKKYVMPAERQKKLRGVFGRLDKDGKEYCTEEDIRGLMNKAEVEKFFKDFDKQGDRITYLEFANYYCDISESMDDDGKFTDKLKHDWP